MFELKIGEYRSEVYWLLGLREGNELELVQPLQFVTLPLQNYLLLLGSSGNQRQLLPQTRRSDTGQDQPQVVQGLFVHSVNPLEKAFGVLEEDKTSLADELGLTTVDCSYGCEGSCEIDFFLCVMVAGSNWQ